MAIRVLSVVLALLALAAPATGAAQARALSPGLVAGPRNGWARGAVFYQVFVRSFADSNGDGAGDLPGLIARLDYLNDGDPRTDTDLGVDVIWLMPIFKSPSPHGHDPSDSETVQGDYGTNQDFVRLCREAHRRGVKVIIDLVLNHTSSSHPWFQQSRSATPGPYRDWYVWRADDPGWTRARDTVPAWHGLADQPGRYYYGLFGEELPDLNYRNPAVRAEAKRIARLWLDRGADGFRLDAVRHLVESGPGPGGQEDTDETHAFLKEFAAHVREIRPDAILVGEAWTRDQARFVRYFGDATQVPGGDELPVLFDFALSAAMLEGLKTGNAAPIADRLRAIAATFPKGAIDAPYLTNHDTSRMATQLQADLARLRTAAALLMTLPGAPFIYYGEELGLRQPGNGDHRFERTPMPWNGSPGAGFTTGTPWQRLLEGHETVNVEAESRDPASLLSRYRQMIRLRHASEALRLGELAVLPTEGGVLAFLRRSSREATLVVHNLGTGPATTGPLRVLAGAMAPLFLDPGVALRGTAGAWTVTLPPTSTGVWRLRQK